MQPGIEVSDIWSDVHVRCPRRKPTLKFDPGSAEKTRNANQPIVRRFCPKMTVGVPKRNCTIAVTQLAAGPSGRPASQFFGPQQDPAVELLKRTSTSSHRLRAGRRPAELEFTVT